MGNTTACSERMLTIKSEGLHTPWNGLQTWSCNFISPSCRVWERVV